jgi:hypothetical protein
MTDTIKIPVFVPSNSSAENDQSAKTATVGDTVRRAVNSRVKDIALDATSLVQVTENALAMIGSLLGAVDGQSNVKIDTFKVQFGVSAAGKVAFLGVGGQMQTTAVFEVAFKFRTE